MESGAEQDRTRLGTSTQVELLMCQLHELKTLLQNQKQARHGIQKPISLEDATKTKEMFWERTQQMSQLSLLSIRHAEERQQLRLRHQQEETELDRLIGGQQPI